jgi:hypothetical protein
MDVQSTPLREFASLARQKGRARVQLRELRNLDCQISM